MITVGAADNNIVVEPTKFPDGTCQAWKIPNIMDIYPYVRWSFDFPLDEGELPFIYQLGQLLSFHHGYAVLDVPFLPYSRQDKAVSNQATFGLHTFLTCLYAVGYRTIYTQDVHNPSFPYGEYGLVLIDVPPVIPTEEFEPTAFCFPDKTAAIRYSHLVDKPKVVLGKMRDPSTGAILNLTVESETASPQDGHWTKRILIVDDICDGGRTFIESAKLLHRVYNVWEVGLYVTHGIFSKGLEPLREAGITKIYTRFGEVK